MTIKNTLLTALAIFAICNTGYAVAYDPRTEHDMKPSVEVNLSVLDKLGSSEAMPTPSPASPEHNFLTEQPVKYAAPKAATGKYVHKKHKVRHKHKAVTKKVVAAPPKVDTTPAVRVRGDDEEVPVMVTIPKKTVKPPASGNGVELPPLPSEPGSSKVPSLPPLPSESHAAPATPPASAVLPPLPEKKPEFIMNPTGQITPVTPPALPAVNNAMSAPVPASAPKPPSLPPLPGESGSMNAVPPLPEISSASGNAAPPPIPPLPSASAPPAPASGAASAATAADNGPPPDLRIVFNEAETDIPLGMSSKLDGIAAQLAKNSNLRVSVVAYASGSDAVSIYPKRVSLARGIAVRNYFVSNKSIDVERITVKALGNKNEGGPANRVDLFIIK